MEPYMTASVVFNVTTYPPVDMSRMVIWNVSSGFWNVCQSINRTAVWRVRDDSLVQLQYTTVPVLGLARR